MSSELASTRSDWRMSLGSLRTGAFSAGDLAHITPARKQQYAPATHPNPWAPLFTPAPPFTFEAASDEIGCIAPASPRQIRSNQVVVDNVTVSPRVQIRCYHPRGSECSRFPNSDEYTFVGLRISPPHERGPRHDAEKSPRSANLRLLLDNFRCPSESTRSLQRQLPAPFIGPRLMGPRGPAALPEWSSKAGHGCEPHRNGHHSRSRVQHAGHDSHP